MRRLSRSAMPMALELPLRKQCRSRLASLMLPFLALRSASFAAPGSRLEPAIVRGVATQSVKVMLRTLVARLLPASVIVRTKLLSVASASVLEWK